MKRAPLKIVQAVILILVGLALGVGLLFAIEQIRHPVQMTGAPFLSATASQYATARGTWTSEPQGQAPPVQTSEIRCIKQLMICTEATALVSDGGVLNVISDSYDVADWQESRIVYKNDAECVNYVYTMDFLTKSVTGMAARKASTIDPDCAAAPLTLRLSLRGGAEAMQALQKTDGARNVILLIAPVILIFLLWFLRATLFDRRNPARA